MSAPFATSQNTQRGGGAIKATPSPPSDGGEGRGEEARFSWIASLLGPLPTRSSRGEEEEVARPMKRDESRVPALALGAVIIVCFTTFCGAGPQTNFPAFAALADLSQPAKRIPFKEVILTTTQHRILDFDTNNPAHVALHQKISTAANAAATKARTAGLFTARANEAGNHIEAFVKAALKETGLKARTPITTDGDAQTAGYPDLEISGDPPCYLELKTYNAATANTTQRSFYYSPSAHPKVTRDALHLLLAYQLEKTERDGRTAFLPIHWKLITLECLEVDLKFEFNQSNRGLYGKEAGSALLSEGSTE